MQSIYPTCRNKLGMQSCFNSNYAVCVFEQFVSFKFDIVFSCIFMIYLLNFM